MTRYTEIHNHSVNAVCNPSHKHSNIMFPEKKVSYSGEGIMKKKKKQQLVTGTNNFPTTKATVFTGQTSHNSIHSSWISDCF